MPFLQDGSVEAPGPPPANTDPLWRWYSDTGVPRSGGPSALGTGLGLSRGSAAGQGGVAVAAGEARVGSRLADSGQDWLRGGWVSAPGEPEEESALWKKGTWLCTGE